MRVGSICQSALLGRVCWQEREGSGHWQAEAAMQADVATHGPWKRLEDRGCSGQTGPIPGTRQPYSAQVRQPTKARIT